MHVALATILTIPAGNPFDIGDVLSYVSQFITSNAGTLAGLMGLGILVKWAGKLPRRFAK